MSYPKIVWFEIYTYINSKSKRIGDFAKLSKCWSCILEVHSNKILINQEISMLNITNVKQVAAIPDQGQEDSTEEDDSGSMDVDT